MVKPGLIIYLYTKIDTIHHRIDHSGKKGHPSKCSLEGNVTLNYHYEAIRSGKMKEMARKQKMKN